MFVKYSKSNDVCSVMSRCYKKIFLYAVKQSLVKLRSRDYLLQPSPSITHQKKAKIGKNDDKAIEKPEKKEKKMKEMSESRVKKYRKLFGQQVSQDEKLINYFSCALVAEILLQGHLYVSENYFSFYSNVFGYVTKLVIPISSVSTITREKTAKFFPNAIALQLNEARHVFGSFLSRESAYQLMSSIHRKNELPAEPIEEEAEPDELDGVLPQNEVSSLEDSSSVSGSEGATQYKIPVAIHEVIEEEEAPEIKGIHDIHLSPAHHDPIEIAKVGSYNDKLISEFNLLFAGICLTILLAFFSGLLLLKINSIENQRNSPTLHEFDSGHFTIEDAESILNKNVLIVRNVREQLETLSTLLQNSFDKSSRPLGGDKGEF